MRLALGLLRQSVDTLQGGSKAVSLGNLASILMALDLKTAFEYYEQVLPLFSGSEARGQKAATLHQIGNLHYLQGDYPKALEFYQQSLKIEEEIGDRAGVASSWGQLGLLYERTDQPEQAINFMARAFLLFAGMGMPQARQVQSYLTRLRFKVGGGGFAAAVRGVGLPAETEAALLKALADALAADDPEEPDMRQVLIKNTLAVLTGATDKKGEWWKALQGLQKDAKEQGENNLAGYVDALLRLLEGADPSSLQKPAFPMNSSPIGRPSGTGISKKE